MRAAEVGLWTAAAVLFGGMVGAYYVAWSGPYATGAPVDEGAAAAFYVIAVALGCVAAVAVMDKFWSGEWEVEV